MFACALALSADLVTYLHSPIFGAQRVFDPKTQQNVYPAGFQSDGRPAPPPHDGAPRHARSGSRSGARANPNFPRRRAEWTPSSSSTATASTTGATAPASPTRKRGRLRRMPTLRPGSQPHPDREARRGGDVLRTTSVLPALREQVPAAHIAGSPRRARPRSWRETHISTGSSRSAGTSRWSSGSRSSTS